MRMLSRASVILLMGIVAVPASAQESDERGVKVGEKAPAFTLPDQDGKEHSLEDLLKKGSVAVVFHRSAQW